MSQESGPSVSHGACCNSVPGWISSGIVGLALGAGGALLGIQAFGPVPNPNVASPSSAPVGMPGMGGGGGGAPGMGGGGMMGGGGSKRALTSLVGKLELLSRPDLNLHVELNADQANAIADKLIELNKTVAMTGDQAQEQLDALEVLLTSEQKEVLAVIGLPFGRGGSGGGRPNAGGSSAGGAAPGAGAPLGGGMMAMGGGGNPNENPFTQEVNQKRLTDLLARLAPAAASEVVKRPE